MGYAVFPSLARGISWGASQKIEDGTIRDKMEMGQVMTRQRFSRLRRTWKVEYQFLNSTDLAAIDYFCRATVQGGGLPFYWPNLIENGGFEYNTLGPAPGTPLTSGLVCDGWSLAPGTAGSVAALQASVAHSGAFSLQLSGVESYSLGANATAPLRVFSSLQAVVPGQTIQVAGFLNVSLAAMPAGSSFLARIGFFFADSAGQLLEVIPGDLSAVTSGWTPVIGSGVAPANATSVYAECCLFLVNSTSAAIVMPATPYLTANFDDIGLALVSQTATYGNMPSNGPIPVAVRFPKPIEVMDSGWVNNGPSYRVQFELEEV